MSDRSHSLRKLTLLLTTAVALTGLPQLPARAQGLAGPYLAAVQADLHNNYAVAADYYRQTLLYTPEDERLQLSALVASICAGDIGTAADLAARMHEGKVSDPHVGLTLIADALAREDFDTAGALAGDAAFGLHPLVGELLKGWIALGKGSSADAVAIFDAIAGNDAMTTYGQYHKALALAAVGDFEAASGIMAGADGNPLHVSRSAILAHATMLAQIDRRDEAVALLDAEIRRAPSDSGMVALRDQIGAGAPVALRGVTNAREGAAEALLLMGSALSRDAADRSGLVYARLAAHVRPGLDEAILLAAETLQAQGQHDLAIESYARISAESDWYVTAESGRSEALRASGREEAGIEALQGLARLRPADIAVQVALGDALRVAERHAEAAEAYTRAVDGIDEPDASHWGLFYSRGIAFERTRRWPEAEADFRKALELEPEQPLVLNYLGYSLVEKREKLDEAQAMIETAVAARPDDGYIVDSLAWVLYRLGKYDEAVAPMERAVELMPVDPIINDHLGDVYWMVGRKREAEFQWKRALSFGPETEAEADRIRRKLEVGLDVVMAEEGAAGQPAATDEAAPATSGNDAGTGAGTTANDG
jgi:tetratricopeptide (TPR) repeat protein